jgi:hypothetical protein
MELKIMLIESWCSFTLQKKIKQRAGYNLIKVID